jgi:diguanylate cyclase (GGDEF)-like protein/PAS domain S-box-containing protein
MIRQRAYPGQMRFRRWLLARLQRDERDPSTANAQLRAVLDAAPIGIMLTRPGNASPIVNSQITAFLQLDTPPGSFEAFEQYVEPADRELFAEIARAAARGHSVSRKCRVLHPTLGTRYVRIISAPAHGGAELHGSIFIIQDIHDEIIARQRLEQFRAIADNTSDIVGIASTRGLPDYLNPAGQEFFGADTLSLGDVAGVIPPEYHHIIFNDAVASIERGSSWSGELELFDRFGQRRPMSAVAVGVRDELGRVDAFAVTYRDIGERKRMEARLAFEAGHDVLTGLPNRQELFHALGGTTDRNENVAVLFCDLDGFKTVNDSLGHAVGDRLLQAVSERLANGARQGDLVGRLGGDEFLLVCRNIADPDECVAIAQRLIELVRQPIHLDGRDHAVSMSIGIALGAGEISASELVQQADLAMYSAKRVGRRRIAVFDQEMRTRADHRLELEADLRAAFERGEFDMHYQPILNTTTGDVLGFEALARWNHPRRGLMHPSDFMSIIDHAGFAAALGEFVLTEATQTAAMLRRIVPTLAISVNLSASQLTDPRLVANIATALALAQLPADALTIEIIEETVMDDLAAALPRLDALRNLGVRFAIDDFGTGYSNLSMLKEFSADYVKIDRSLISGLAKTASESQVARLVLSLTAELGFAPIAEGVETIEQLRELRNLGCHFAQGYFLARPMNRAEALEYISPRNVVSIA